MSRPSLAEEIRQTPIETVRAKITEYAGMERNEVVARLQGILGNAQ